VNQRVVLVSPRSGMVAPWCPVVIISKPSSSFKCRFCSPCFALTISQKYSPLLKPPIVSCYSAFTEAHDLMTIILRMSCSTTECSSTALSNDKYDMEINNMPLSQEKVEMLMQIKHCCQETAPSAPQQPSETSPVGLPPTRR
jgi:hypothetical protein